MRVQSSVLSVSFPPSFFAALVVVMFLGLGGCFPQDPCPDDANSECGDATPPPDDDDSSGDDDTTPDDDDSAGDDDDSSGDDDTTPTDDDDSAGDDDDTTPADDDDSAGDDDDSTEPGCDPTDALIDVPYVDIAERYIDHSVAVYGSTSWATTGVTWVDIETITLVSECSADPLSCVLTPIYAPWSSSLEAELLLPPNPASWLPLGYPDADVDNGIYVFVQPDGTTFEVNFLELVGPSLHGWVLPDNVVQNICTSPGINSVQWIGGHGGSHITATQAIRLGELSAPTPIGRPLPVEVDHTHLSALCNGGLGYRWPAASADWGYGTLYTGSNLELCMGSVLTLPDPAWDCASRMRTTQGERLCEVLRDHGWLIVDDSYGLHEVQFPVERGVVEEQLALSQALDLVNANAPDGDGNNQQATWFDQDVDDLMREAVPLVNPTMAWALP